jgi:hypothetical protein
MNACNSPQRAQSVFTKTTRKTFETFVTSFVVFVVKSLEASVQMK